MEQSAYLHLLRRWAWTLVLAAWVAGLVGYVVATTIPPTYEARARLLVGPVNTDLTTVRAAESLALTYAEAALFEPQLQSVIDKLDLDMTTNELGMSLSVVANATTRIITIDAASSDAEMAATIANTVSDELIAYTSALVRRPEGELHPIDPAEAPSTSTATSASVIAFLAGAAGFLTAGLVVIALEYLSHVVRTKHDLAGLTGLPVLGGVNVAHGYVGTAAQPLVVEAAPTSRTAYGYQTLATRMPLGLPGDDEQFKSLLVVGAQTGQGTGEFTANLAAVIAKSGRSVALIDGDEVEQEISTMFDREGGAGLGELLALDPDVVATTDGVDRVRIKRVPDVTIIAAGNQPARSVPVDRAGRLLEQLGSKADIVIVSGAALDRSATALTWARLVDASVIVARADVTSVENLRAAVESLQLADATLAGAVLLERQRRERLGAGRRARATGTGSERQAVSDKSAR